MERTRSAWPLLLVGSAAVTLTLLLAVGMIPLPFGEAEFRITLPHDYYLWGPDDSVSLWNAFSEEIIDSHIDGYYVYNEAIVGHVTKREGRFRDSVPGYFVVDLKTAKVEQGLSRAEWRQRLRECGVQSAPALHTPTEVDERRGHNKPSAP